MMCTCHAVQQEPITPEFSCALIDGVIIPRPARRRLSKSRRAAAIGTRARLA
jgi:hypothetical protein